MTTPGTIPFRKMNGLGNDFVVIDARARPLALGPAQAQRIADRERGVGCDQLILLGPSDQADVFMTIRNSDGGEVDACGNAARCVAAVVAAELGRPGVTIETNAAVLGAVLNADATVTIDMGVPLLRWDEIPLAEEFHDTRTIELQVGPIDDPVLHTPSAVNVGNPHCIFWVDDPEAHDLAAIGPILEHHPLFPERANISLAQVTAPDAMTLKVWERGAGLTMACGTGACAALVAAHRRGLAGRGATMELDGGPLRIAWGEDNRVTMTGPVAVSFRGKMDGALLG